MNIAVYCGSSVGEKESYVKAARELGTWIGENGHTLVYGGSNTGLMGAVADAVLLAGGKVIGVQPNVPCIQARKHLGITQCIETETIAERRTVMIKLADAYVALPGGVGTLDEITEVMSLQSLKMINAPIVFFDALQYYSPIKQLIENIVTNKFGRSEYFENVFFSDDILKIGTFIEEK